MRLSRPMLLIALCVACSSSGSKDSLTDDLDGDGLSNGDEGKSSNRDTDGDGIPDYRDLDADGDGIADSVEIGDPKAPRDTDSDGTPDYMDVDADGDLVSDSNELGVTFEIVDTDGDGTPDYLDLDSDGDSIPDGIEQNFDANRDGIGNFQSLDSDGDGLSDGCEAGDADPATLPRDTDGDGRPDYIDPDSDDDGIGDGQEDANHNCVADPGESSALIGDSDGDAIPDLIEKIAGSDPSDPASVIPATDFYFILPYMRNRGTGDLDFSTSVRQADIFFSMDNTGSMEGETANIQTNLVSSIVPGIGAVIQNAAFGLGSFRDFPIDPYGNASDRPYELRQAITTDAAIIGAAIGALPAPGGGLDIPESGFEALYQWATGVGISAFGMPAFQSNVPDGIGGAGFRKDSLPIIVQVTDAVSHVPGDYSTFGSSTHGRDELIAACQAIGARVVGINSLENSGTAFEPRAQLEDIAVETRAHISPDANGDCPTGIAGSTHPSVQVNGVARCPAVFDVQTDGAGLSSLVVDAIRELAQTGEIDVSTRSIGKLEGERGEVLPSGTTTANFLKSITPVPPPPTGAIIDGDVFRHVQPGSTVTFRLDAYNDFVPEIETEQLFLINVQVIGDGVTLLDTRRVFVVVPRRIELFQ